MKSLSIRIDRNLLEKLRILAERENRSLSRQITVIVRHQIEAYEKEHGRIPYQEETEPRQPSQGKDDSD